MFMSKETKPVLVFVRGVPGSGKSFLAKALQQSLGEDKITMLDPDHINFDDPAYIEFSKTLSKEGLDEKIHPFRWLRTAAYGGITGGKIIIWNQPFTIVDIFKRLITHLQDYASEHQIELPVLIVEVEVEPALAKARINQRIQAGGHGPSNQTLTSRIADYKSYANEGYKTVVVKGDADISESVSQVIKTLDQLRTK
jgi:gluconate kinase